MIWDRKDFTEMYLDKFNINFEYDRVIIYPTNWDENKDIQDTMRYVTNCYFIKLKMDEIVIKIEKVDKNAGS